MFLFSRISKQRSERDFKSHAFSFFIKNFFLINYLLLNLQLSEIGGGAFFLFVVIFHQTAYVFF